ncbi:MAG: radical SAM protein [Candidatus Omnitrophica bacterium]|nr:radical SAM protein [Candidatus Omnitrophota bacterium]
MRLEEMEAYQGIKKFATGKGAMISLTFRCQFKCEHCGVVYYQKKDISELTTEEIKGKILDRLKDCGIEVAYFFGGEPTLHPDLIELVRYATQKSLYTRFDTNGFKLADRDYVVQLKEAGIKFILISIDSANADDHDAFRKVKGAWVRAVEGIKNCVKEQIPVGISTVVTPQRLRNNDLKNLINLGKSWGVSRIRILTPIMCGKWIKQGIELSAEDKKQFYSLLEPDFVYWEEYCDGTVPFVCCSIVRWGVYISAYGDVQPCCYIPIKFGNVREEDLKNVIDRMWSSSFFEVKKEVINLNDCPMNYEEIRNKIMKLAEEQGGYPVIYSD